MKKTKVLITSGEVDSIGPEVTEKALLSLLSEGFFEKNELEAIVFGKSESFSKGFQSEFEVRSAGNPLDWVKEATDLAMADPEFTKIVTGPLDKSKRAKEFPGFTGHTGFLGEQAGLDEEPLMVLASKKLIVSPLTVHVPFKKVKSQLTKKFLRRKLELCIYFLTKMMGLKTPRLAVCGLNPHASDNGLLGDEEETLILPVICELRKKFSKIEISDPLPGDTVFHQAYHGAFDMVAGLYHDQALAPFKLIAFDDGVNISVGLPFVRTSVDHGTAYDIAGKNKANPASMIEAIRWALNLNNQ